MLKLIYLDSSDFSDLSVPTEQLQPDDALVLAALRRAKAEGKARIVLSPPLLSEAVHATLENKKDSMRRASLMRELCETNTLRYPTEICKAELNRALSELLDSQLRSEDIFSSDDEWFGFQYDLHSLKDSRKNALQKLDERLKTLPRAQRRKLKSQLDLSKARSKPLCRQLLKGGSWNSSNEFPLNLIDQSFFVDWFLGEKSDIEANRYFRRLFSDPYFLFIHVVDETGHREQLYSMLRQPGEKLSESLTTAGKSLIRMFELAEQIGKPIDARMLADEFVSDSMLREVAGDFSEQPISHLDDKQVRALIQRCPSVSILIHAFREYFHKLIQSAQMRFRSGNFTPATPKRSDFGDFVHLFYAPYVDIFRCDARFADHLRNFKPTKGRIAARRNDILSLL